jgi:hypothetical protein
MVIPISTQIPISFDVTLAGSESHESETINSSNQIEIGSVVEVRVETMLKVRSDPVADVPQGAQVVVKANSADKNYFWVTYQGSTGWIKASDVSKNKVQKIEYSK